MKGSQQGATLFVALIILLIITLLALSGARETSLESRMTGNLIEQQDLLNLSEATLREGERSLTQGSSPVQDYVCDATGDYCFLDTTPSYTQDFAKAKAYSLSSSSAPKSMLWYGISASTGDISGQSQNPEYGNMMRGIGVFTYEVNTKAEDTSTGQQVRLRSTVTKLFN